MANGLMVLDPSSMPAHLQEWDDTNIAPRPTVPSLSYEGKAWTVVLNGEKLRMERRNEDGDMVPVPVMKAVLLAFNPNRGRTLYTGGYDKTKPSKPVCWSEDAKVADPAITVAPFEGWTGSCNGCPMSIKGSKVVDGKAVTACQLHRMTAVLPVSKKGLFSTPLRLKLAITSLYDGHDNPLEAEGWFAFDSFIEHLRVSMPGMHTAKIVMKMRFDPNVPHPKVMFAQDRWITAEEQAVLVPLTKSQEVADLISGKWSPNGIDGQKSEPDIDPEVARQAREAHEAELAEAAARAAREAQAAAAVQAPQPALEEDDGLDGEIIPPTPPVKAAPAPAPAPKPVIVKAAQQAPKATPAAAKTNGATPAPAVIKAVAAAPKPAAAPTKTVSPELDSLLTEWDG